MGWFNHQLARDIFVSFFCYFGFESFRLNICSIGCMTPSSKLISWTKRLPPLFFFGGFQLPQRQLFGKAKKKPKPKWELGKAKNKLTIDLFFFWENIPVISYTTYTNTELDATPPARGLASQVKFPYESFHVFALEKKPPGCFCGLYAGLYYIPSSMDRDYN